MRSPSTNFLTLAAAAALSATAAFSQTVADGGRPFTTTLTGAAEVPGPGDSNATGTVKITLNHGQERVCFEFSNVTNVDGTIVAAHIHRAPVGVAGPVVVPLFAGALDEEGCVNNVNPDLIKDIIQHPAGYYVNIHSTVFPAGAIRGQLAKK